MNIKKFLFLLPAVFGMVACGGKAPVSLKNVIDNTTNVEAGKVIMVTTTEEGSSTTTIRKSGDKYAIDLAGYGEGIYLDKREDGKWYVTMSLGLEDDIMWFCNETDDSDSGFSPCVTYGIGNDEAKFEYNDSAFKMKADESIVNKETVSTYDQDWNEISIEQFTTITDVVIKIDSSNRISEMTFKVTETNSYDDGKSESTVKATYEYGPQTINIPEETPLDD